MTAGDGYFGNKYFPSGYFPDGYFGAQENAAPGSIFGTASGIATTSASIHALLNVAGSSSGLASVSGALTSSVSTAAIIALHETRPAKGAKARRQRRKDEEYENEVEDEIARARREGRLRKIMPNDFDGGSDRPIFVSEESHAEAQAKEKRRKARAARKAVEAKPEAAPVPASSDLIQRLGALSVSDASDALIAAICKVSDMEKAAHLRALEAEAAEDDDMEALLLMMEF